VTAILAHADAKCWCGPGVGNDSGREGVIDRYGRSAGVIPRPLIALALNQREETVNFLEACMVRKCHPERLTARALRLRERNCDVPGSMGNRVILSVSEESGGMGGTQQEPGFSLNLYCVPPLHPDPSLTLRMTCARIRAKTRINTGSFLEASSEGSGWVNHDNRGFRSIRAPSQIPRSTLGMTLSSRPQALPKPPDSPRPAHPLRSPNLYSNHLDFLLA
jgi:hypothetical protein